MMISGRWMAKSSTKSISPRSAMSSMSSVVSSFMWPVSSRTRAGVKPRLMRRRTRVCSGSSMAMIDSGTSSTGRTPWAEEYSSVWRETCTTSSCFDTTHRPLRSSQCTGSLVRNQR